MVTVTSAGPPGTGGVDGSSWLGILGVSTVLGFVPLKISGSFDAHQPVSAKPPHAGGSVKFAGTQAESGWEPYSAGAGPQSEWLVWHVRLAVARVRLGHSVEFTGNICNSILCYTGYYIVLSWHDMTLYCNYYPNITIWKIYYNMKIIWCLYSNIYCQLYMLQYCYWYVTV